MSEISRKTKTIEGMDPSEIPYSELLQLQEPVILKGLVKDWPLVSIGNSSFEATKEYILGFYSGRPVACYTGKPKIKGHFFYNHDLSSRNFEASQVALDAVLDLVETQIKSKDGTSYYVGSTDVDMFLPGFRKHNDLYLNHRMFENNPLLVSAWIGNHTVAAAHYDITNNMACCLVGRRRFTLFPPDQIHNLYPGPFELTPGGQVVSMVNINDPDLDKHPRYRDAIDAGQVAELGPGDVLFYPAMWWHQVEALDAFNVMVNYWWNTSPDFVDSPMVTLLHGLLSLRGRPESERRAWREVFDHYLFGETERAVAHLPENAQGKLGQMNDVAAQRLRAELLNRINR